MMAVLFVMEMFCNWLSLWRHFIFKKNNTFTLCPNRLYSEFCFPCLLVETIKKIKAVDMFRISVLSLVRFCFFLWCSVREETMTVHKENPYLFTSGYTRG